MSKCSEISLNIQNGRAQAVKDLVQQALQEGTAAQEILNAGMLDAMQVIGEKFKNNEVFVPEMLVAARAMSAGMEILQPHLVQAGIKPIGRAALGTVKGDLHDIGKNLVRIMMEGKGIEVLDLGVDVPAEKFVEAYEVHGITLIACSALLTTTMSEMRTIVDLFIQKGLRDKVTVMIGGAPVNESFCKAIGADYYTADAASAADVAKRVLTGGA